MPLSPLPLWQLESDRTKRAVLAEGIVRPLCHAMGAGGPPSTPPRELPPPSLASLAIDRGRFLSHRLPPPPPELCRGSLDVQQHGCSILARLGDHLGSATKGAQQRACSGSGRARRATDSGPSTPTGKGGAAGAGAGAAADGSGAGSCADGLGYGYCVDGGPVDEEQAEEEIRRLKTLEVRAG